MALPMAIPLALSGAGLLGSIFQKRPKYDMSAIEQMAELLRRQEENINTYFTEAGSALESQFGTQYGQTMQDAISALANRGIYESPVAERSLNRTRTALAETYATAKSQLAGQKMQALGSIDQQRVSYLQNLAQINYNRQLAKQQQRSQLFGSLGGLGGSLMGFVKQG